MKHQKLMLLAILLLAPLALARAADRLAEGFATPPGEARLHAYWWWLNGNVTREAITRDLEAMKEKGFGGALIMDAGGAAQDGNRQVPHGPDFGSPQWRELYQHTLREAMRLKMELALNIQSGWNLGGPGVTPDDAAKILCWTETVVEGPGSVTAELPAPKAKSGLLREVAVMAVPNLNPGGAVTVSSAHQAYPAAKLADGNADSFWVSDGRATGTDAMAWIRVTFDRDRLVSRITLTGRAGHGPKALDVFAAGADGARRRIAGGRPGLDGLWQAVLEQPQTIREVEFRVTDAYDSAPVGGRPRNVQVAEISVEGPGWQWPSPANATIPNWDVKALFHAVGGANSDLSVLVADKAVSGKTNAITSAQVMNLSRFVDANGHLRWTAPAGSWRIYRFCYTIAPRAAVSTCSEGWGGLALDPMDANAFQRYWDAVVEPLMQDAAQIRGNTLKYLHTDSWEIEPFNWTANFPEEFKKRCGYDLTPWLPVLARNVVGDTEASERFLHDFRKTVAALVAENHYGPFLSNAHRHGLQVRAESGGPHGVPIDAQHCLGIIDTPMSEFWATSWRHRVPEKARFFVKQPASAAHTYGKKIVAAEGFTTVGPHWQETVWDNLKPNFDRALCEGLNQLVWTLVTCSPAGMGLPGQEMFPGTHFNPNSTWWRQSEGFLAYINRCQWMLQQGLFVADVLYYYGDLVPNFAGLKAMNPANLPPGYDYDVASEYVLLNRVSVKAGRLVLPDGMSYGALVLPPHRTLSLAVLRRLCKLAEAGAILIGPRPDSSSGLKEWQQGDAEAKTLIDRLWGKEPAAGMVKHAAATDWLKSSRLASDFAVAAGADPGARLDYIHRRDGETEIYFVANPADKAVRAQVRFRAPGRAPELWDPRDGRCRTLPEWRTTAEGQVELPLELEAYGSAFLVFRKPANGQAGVGAGKNVTPRQTVLEIKGPWQLSFDPAWFYPDNSGTGGRLLFARLEDWTRRTEEAVRHFSGAAIYRTTFEAPGTSATAGQEAWLSLGEVREMARVNINGRDLGVAWCPPWSVRIPAGTLAKKGNRLEIEVVNFWPNRLIGDAKLPLEQRRTRTNITKFYEPKGDAHYTTLMPAGLLGPVTMQIQTF